MQPRLRDKSLGSFQVSHGGQGADSHVLRQRAVLLASGRVDFAASEKMAKALRMLNAFGLGSVLPEGATGNELHRLRQLSWTLWYIWYFNISHWYNMI